MNLVARLYALIASAIVSGIAGSIIQTQINLSELIQLGATASLSIRLWTTFDDILRFGPVMALISLCALVPAMTIGQAILSRINKPKAKAAYALFGWMSLVIAFLVMGMVLPFTYLISATRNPLNFGLICLAGAAGGYTYAALYARATQSPASARYGITATTMLLAPIISFALTSPQPMPTVSKVDPSKYTIETVVPHLNRPWSVAFLPSGERLVTEMVGRLLELSSDGHLTKVDVSALPDIYKAGGSSGLLEVAVDREFAQNSFIYLSASYGELEANGTQLIRARLVNHRLEDVKVIFQSSLKPKSGNHGGRIAILQDNTVLLTVGDGIDTREVGQRLDTTLGKVVRVDRDGNPPTDNPFVGRKDVRPEIYSYGHRNAQGIAVDNTTGKVYVSEHGPRGGDEINLIERGANYGWPIVSGGIDYSYARVTPFAKANQFVAPIYEWTPSIAPGGIAIYRGELFDSWNGDLLIPVMVGKSVRRVSYRENEAPKEWEMLGELNTRIRDVKVAPDGSLYVITDGEDGSLLRVVPRA